MNSLLNKQLSTKTFLVVHLLILVISLLLLTGLSLFLNQDNRRVSLKDYLPVTTQPRSFNLEIANPDDELLTFDPNIIVSGKTSPKAAVVITQTTPGSLQEETILGFEATGLGQFTKTLTLVAGLNQIKITAFDDLGNAKQAERTIFYSEEKI